MTEPVLGTRLTDRKRASIIEAAVEEFRRCGFYAASMNRIAELANVSKRTLYRHFESKESLFDAIIEELMERSERLTVAEFDPDEDLAEQLATLAKAEVQLMASEPVQALARAGISRLLGDPEVARAIDHNRFFQRVIRWLKQAKSAGQLTDMSDVEFAAQQFCGLLHSFAFWPPIIRGEAPLSTRKRNKIVNETVRMFLARYGA